MGSKQLISERERQLAIHELEGCLERGFIDEDEFRRRADAVAAAAIAEEIKPLLADLHSAQRGRRELRITDHERGAVMRRLEIHHADGQLSDQETERRRDLADSASTAAELAEALAELPPLAPGREPRDERFVSNAEREQALEHIAQAWGDGRLEQDQYLARVQLVEEARTQNEIKASYRGIPQARFSRAELEKHREAAETVGRAAVGTGARLAFGFVVIAWIGICSLIIIGSLLVGVDPTVPVLAIVLLTLMLMVLLWLPGFVSKGIRR